ncbi:MAG TPA: hypothetical protein VFG59_13615 [Anaeromyxobacter sp.]|nr:hypothetical protein [Anaeromyxobacter sp.]
MEPFPARSSIRPAPGAGAEEGPCTVELGGGALTIAPQAGPPLRIRFTEIERWEVADYAVTLDLSGGARVVLSALGKRLEPFRRALPAARKEHLGEALLLEERGPAGEESGEFRWAGGETEACRVRLQKTSLIVFPRQTLPFLVGYGEVKESSFDAQSFAVVLRLRDLRRLELVRFGKRTEALLAGLSERMDALASRALAALGALAPDLSALSLRELGALLPDGLPAARAEIERAAPGAWEAMFARAFAAGARRDAASHLLGRAQSAFLAVKETHPPDAADGEPPACEGEPPGEESDTGPAASPGPRPGSTLPDELAGRQILYLFQVGSALALEVPSSTESATYLFRSGVDPAGSARAIVRALAAIQFRREPISLPEEQLLGGRGARYALALKLVPELRAAREAFLGRAVHAGAEAWRKALDLAMSRC